MTRWLVRFDDICPTADWRRWDRLEPVLDEIGATPMVGIIPENKDPELQRHPPIAGFWDRVRSWQAKGWIIAQHGHRHLYDTTSSGIVPWWPRSEFAGHPMEEQRRRIAAGREILRAEKLEPAVFSAPGHSFDAATLEVLAELHIETVSDGVGFRPTRDRHNLVWLPLQPWPIRWPAPSVATLCVHLDTHPSVEDLARRLRELAPRLVGRAHGYARLVASASRRTSVDALYEEIYWPAFRVRQLLAAGARRLLGRPA